jgi:hypothetical protein
MAQDFTEKVALLLAKAEGTDNPLEAEAYTAKAEELMLKHGISEAEAATRRPGHKAEEVVIERIKVYNKMDTAQAQFGAAVAPAFNIRGYHSKVIDGGFLIWLVGHKSDVEQAAVLVRSLLVQSEHALDHWWRTEGRVHNPSGLGSHVRKREFMFGFAGGVRERLRETKNRVVAESEPGTDLVLRDRVKIVDDWTKQNIAFSKTKSRSLKGGDYSAGAAGREAGRDAVGTKKVTA